MLNLLKKNNEKPNQMLLTMVLRDKLKNNYNVPYIRELNKQRRPLQQKHHFKI